MLVRRDALLFLREGAALFPRWQDVAWGVVGLFLVGMLLRHMLPGAGERAVYGGAIVAGWAGFTLWRLLRLRLAHETEVGLMAAAALDPVAWRRYALTFGGAGMLGVLMVGLTLDWPGLVWAPLPFLFGMIVRILGPAGKTSKSETLTVVPSRLRWVSTALHCGHGLVLGLIAATALVGLRVANGPMFGARAVVIVAIAGALTLKRPDPAVVRFMDFIGNRPWRVLWWHLRATLGFWLILTVSAWAVAGPIALGELLVVVLGWSLLLALQLALYQMLTPRVAEAFLGAVLLTGALTMAIFVGTPALSIVMVAIAIAGLDLWLMRRAGRDGGILA
ncbi:hypothetical protein [Acidomonas methanolica]|uniref:hypothetical protein n=1 Tax=Acidomonas methanolica TaxID=437 RepID=UPI002119C80D|nr:hypothetical protein [Acidomonas methanolica]MCQ9157193.1 hypothetical protein [Acidomonas methanolica]